MSKYIKLEDAIHNINLEVIGRKEYTGDMKANLFFALDDLPTIEVSEDCISRADLQALFNETTTSLMDKIEQKDIEHLVRACVMVTEMIQDAPSVVPKDHSGESAEMVGEWLHKRMPHDSYHITGQCSICKERSRINNYCPWCGAKMKGAEE